MKSKVYSKLHWLLSLMAIVWMAFVPASMYAASVPTNVHVNDLAPISATLAWEIEVADRHDYDLRVATSTLTSTELGAATVGNPASVVIAENAVTLTEPEYAMSGLTAGTHYYVYIRENAEWDYGSSSNWATYEFSTPCEATAELPIAANFDGSSTIPTCWSTGGNAPTVVGSVHRGESGNAVKISPTSESGSYLYSPVLASNAGAYYLTAYVYGAAGADYAIGIAATEDLLNVQSILEGKISQANTWTFIDAAIPAELQATLEGGVEYVWVFYAEASNNAVNFYVDDIELAGMPPCISPSIPVVSDMTANSAVLSWTERGSAAAWVVEYTNSTDNQTVETSENPLLLNELLSNTTYAVRIKSVCGEESESEWTSWVSFKTPCGVMNLPYTENFNSYTGVEYSYSARPANSTLPDCWSADDNNNNFIYVVSTSGHGYSGNGLEFSATSSVSEASYAFLPAFNAPVGAILSLKYKYESTSNGALTVGYVTVAGDKSTFVPVSALTPQTSFTASNDILLPATATVDGILYPAIRYEATNYYYACIDDVQFEAVPTCPKPTDLAALGIETDKIKLHWTAGGEETSWILTYQLGSEAAVSVPVDGTAEYVIEGLAAQTSYTLSSLSLQAICSETDHSAVATFADLTTKTLCDAVTEYETNFENESEYGYGHLPDCWAKVSASPDSYPYVLSSTISSSAHSGAGYLYAYAASSSPFSGIVSLPELNGNMADYRISLWAKAGAANAQLAVGVLNDLGDASSFTAVESLILNTTYTEYTVSLASYTGSGKYVAIKYDNVQTTIYIDDIILEQIPSCERPANIEGSAKNATTVLVSITDADASHSAWEVIVGEAGINPNDAEPILVSSKQVSVTLPFEMAAGASYDIAVRAVCDADDKSAWKMGQAFTFIDWSGLNPNIAFSTSGTYPWTLSNESGVWTASSSNYHVASSQSSLTATFEVPDNAKTTLTFDYEVDGETNWDYLIIFIDDACDAPNPDKTSGNYDANFGKKSNSDGTVSGTWSIEFMEPGIHRVIWMYYKDTSTDYNRDKAFVYNVTLSSFNCIEPTTFTLGTITENSAVLNWNATSADQYKVLLFTEAQTTIDEAAAVQSDVVSTTTKTFEGLEASTLYYAYVQSLCGEEPSAWSAATQFHTECSAEAVPYSESFENEASLLCWNVKGEPAVVDLVSAAFEGDHAVSVQSDSVGLMLISPRFEAATLAPYVLNMAVRATSAADITVGVIIDPSDVSTYIDLGEINLPTPNVWNEYSLSLDMLATEDYEEYASAQYLAVYIPTYKTILFDAISVAEPAQCPKPTALHVQPVGEEVVIDWTSDAAAHNLEIALGDETIFSGTVEKPYTPSGLVGNTEYKVRVQAVCDEELSSEWTPWMSFKSPCSYASIPMQYDFEDVTDIPDCWYQEQIVGSTSTGSYNHGNSAWKINTSTSDSYNHDSSHSLQLQDSYNGIRTILVMPMFNSEREGGLTLSFWMYRTTGTTKPDEGVKVWVNNQPNLEGATALMHVTRCGGVAADELKVAPITLAGWYQYEKALPIEGPAYVIFEGISEYGSSSYLDDIAILESPSCMKPSGLALGEVGSTSAKLTWTANGDESQWQLIYKLSTKSTADTLSIEGTPEYTISGLTSSTSYTVSGIKLRAICSETDSSDVVSFSNLSFTTECDVQSMPFEEDFSTETLSSCWNKYSVLFADGVSTANITSTGNWNHSATVFTDGEMKLNVWGQNCSSWLVTPYIAISGEDAYLSFDMALTKWNSTTASDSIGHQADDKFMVLISTNGSTWNLANATIWSNEVGAANSYDAIPNTGTTVTIPLGAYDGQVIRIAFYAESTVSNGDNDLHISNIEVTVPATCDRPSALTVAAISGSSATIHIDGGEAWEYALNSTDATVSFSETNTIELTELTSNTTYTLYVRTVCSEDNKSAWKSVTFQTDCDIQSIPFYEGFDDLTSGIPTCWDNSQGTTTDASFKWSYNSSGNGGACLCFDTYSNYSGNTNFLYTPTFYSDETLLLTFDCKNPDGGDFSVYITTDGGATLEPLFTGLTNISSWTTKEYELSAYVGQAIQIVFKGTSNYAPYGSDNYLYLDNVKVSKAPSCYPLEAISVENVGRTEADIVITPNRDHAPASYDLVISETELDAEAREAAAMSLADPIYHATGLTRATTYYVYARANCGEDVSEWSELTVSTKGLVGEDCITIGQGTSSVTVIPINPFYRYTTSEQIFTADEMGMGGTITNISFYVISGSDTRNITVYLAHTNKSTFSGSSDAVNVSASNQVFSGSITLSPSSWNTITLTTPFEYNGTDNLLLVFDDNTGSYTSNRYFAADTKTDAVWYKNSDSDNVDPLNITYAGTVSSSRNQIRFCVSYSIDACPTVDLASISHELTGNGTSSAIIRWGESDGDYANSYDLYYATEAVQDFTDIVPQHDSIEALSIELTGLSEDTEYYVYIRTNCDGEGQSDGSSNWSDAYVFRTFANCQALSGLYVELLSKTSAQANWDATVQAPNFQYILSEEELDAEDLETAQLKEAGLVDTFAVMQDLTPGTTYYFYVANRCGEEDENHSVYVSTSFTMPAGCPAVENLEAYYQAFNAVGLKWNRGRFGEEEEWEVGIVGNEASARTVYDSTAMFIGMEPATDYTFYVKAVCGVEDSSAVATLDVQTYPRPIGGDIDIADGTQTNSYLPVYGFYCDDPQRTQSVYPAEMLSSLLGTPIQGLHYYVSSGSSSSWSNKTFVVRIGITESANLANGWASETLTTVYVGTLTASVANGMEIIFDTPFVYMGGNLVVEFDLSEDTSGYTSCSFLGVTATSASRYVYGSDYPNGTGTAQSFLPKVTFLSDLETGDCRRVTNLQIEDITFNSAHVSWLPSDVDTEWAVVHSETALTTAELDVVEADTIAVMDTVFTDLTPGYLYHFYIRSLCSENLSSDWKEMSYRTLATCVEPVEVEAKLIDADSVVVAWRSSNATFAGTYSVAYGPAAAFNLANAQTYTLIENVADTALTIHNLDAVKAYSVAVKAICSEEDESIWSEVLNFTSACMPITYFPWSEDFESYETGNFNADCWKNEHISGSGTYVFAIDNTSIGDNATKKLKLPDMSSGTHTLLALPVMTIEQANACMFSLDIYRDHSTFYSGSDEGIRIFVSYTDEITDSSIELAFLPREYAAEGINVPSELEAGWYSYQFPIPMEGNVYILIQGESRYGTATYMDNFRVSRLAAAAPFYDNTCNGATYEGYGFTIEPADMQLGLNTFTRVEEATSDLMADSLYTLVLNVGESKVTYLTDTACAYSAYDDYGFHIGSVNPNRTTPYERHEATVTGCDSLISLTLFVPQREFEVSDAICEGQEYQLGDTTLTTSGTYTRTLTGARFGCDSVVTLTLEVLPAHEEIEATICEGESYPFGGEDRTEAGTYEATLVNRLGCEYTVTLTLAVTEKTYYNYEAVFCAGDIYSDENFNGLDEGGIYKDTLSSVAGCDSIIVLNLIKHEPEEVDLNIEIADGDVYVFDNKTFDHDTTYTAHFVDQFSCDSIVTLHLTVATGLQEVLNDAQLKAAEKFMHNGILYIRANGILYDARGKRVMIRKEEE